MGESTKRWQTRDLGSILRLDKPSVSVLPTGEVIVFHRLNQDQFVEFRSAMTVADPETAGTARVRELYGEKGVTPKQNPWWKFW